MIEAIGFLTSAFGGAFVGVLLARWFDARVRGKRVANIRHALSLEITENIRRSITYLIENHWLPGYRLMDSCYLGTYVTLLNESTDLRKEEVEFLQEFYDHVRQFNDALGLLNDMSPAKEPTAMYNAWSHEASKEQWMTARLKASHLIPAVDIFEDGKLFLMVNRLPTTSSFHQEIVGRMRVEAERINASLEERRAPQQPVTSNGNEGSEKSKPGLADD